MKIGQAAVVAAALLVLAGRDTQRAGEIMVGLLDVCRRHGFIQDTAGMAVARSDTWATADPSVTGRTRSTTAVCRHPIEA
jgi:hypothetical protein